MEKVWRKVNQGLSSNKSCAYRTDTTDSAAGFGEETKVVAIAEQKLKQSQNEVPIENKSTKIKRRRKGNGRKNMTRKEKVEQVEINEPTLREKAVARLKLFNFNLNWDLQMTHCKPCGSKPGNIITRRLYRHRRQSNDNELYRSNSFKFERFERREETDNVSNVEKRKIAVCDDYSLPIDFLKKRPSSFDPSLTHRLPQDWNSSSLVSTQPKVKFIEGYSQPKDTKALLEPNDLQLPLTSIKSTQNIQLYSDSSLPRSSENESEHKIDSPDNISDDFINPSALDGKSLNQQENKPSPYYYSDLQKRPNPNTVQSSGAKLNQPNLNKKREKSSKQVSNYSRRTDLFINKDTKQDFTCGASSDSLTSEDSDCSECKNRRDWHAKALAHVQAKCNISVDVRKTEQNISDVLFTPQAIFGLNRDNVQGSSNCSLDDNSEIIANEDMSNSTREVYETAFDSKVASNNDELHIIDNITKNPLLFPFPSDQFLKSNENDTQSSKQQKNSFNQATQEFYNVGGSDTVTAELQGLSIKDDVVSCKSYNTPSPPSSAPLPLKFPLKSDSYLSSSIKSTSNIPDSNALQHPRLTSLRATQKAQQSCSGFLQESIFKKYGENERPHSVIGIRRLNQLKCTQDGKKRKLKNFTSTDSIRSSNNSIDSMRSSTSDEARSTSSSESHRSSSISSHDSDSGTNFLYTCRNQLSFNTKLHVLSPISDKSIQEPDTEMHKTKVSSIPSAAVVNEGNENEEAEFKNINISNKLISSLASQEIRGSDSGISLQSRDDTKPKLMLNRVADENVELDLPHGLKDLPFDMPKLRRRRIPTKNDINTSGSATSVDLGELPFDLPKLKPRVGSEHLQNDSDAIQLSASPKTSNNEMKDFQRQSLTLNFNDRRGSKPIKFGTLDGQHGSKVKSLNLGLNKYNHSSNLIDVKTPFDRQNWYHGAISRIEAENILRPLEEGSFLVRNSESTKQDYSLSLKSAKGFMHMRIQKTGDSNKYILGQFSRPFDTIPEMIQHFCLNRLPVRGAEHMCLVEPVIVQIL